MSNLSRRIRNLGRPSASAIGFAPGRSDERPRQLLVAAEAADASGVRAAVDAGVDALLVPAELAREAVQAAGRRPVGVRFGAASPEAVGAAAEAGADFFVFDDAATPAAALLRGRMDGRPDLGRVLVLDEDRSEERLRTLAALNLDAVLIEGLSPDLTVRQQLALRRIAGFAGSALLAALADAGAPSAQALEVWRDAGAASVLVAADPGVLEATVAAAAAVPAQRRPRDDRPPLVPFVSPPEREEDGEPF
jgi:beta-glucosidase-like glycosyl hydrolase